MTTVQHYLNFTDANVINMSPQFNSNGTVQNPEPMDETWDYFNHGRVEWMFNRMGFSDVSQFNKMQRAQFGDNSTVNLSRFSTNEKVLIGVGLLGLYFYAIKK
jgi:hypothetical protein